MKSSERYKPNTHAHANIIEQKNSRENKFA